MRTDVLGPEGDNATTADNATNAPYGFGTSMGLAVYAGQVYPVWAGNFNEASLVNGVPAGNALSIYYQPMVIAGGPRIVSSTMGPVASSTHQLCRHADDRIIAGHRSHQYSRACLPARISAAPVSRPASRS